MIELYAIHARVTTHEDGWTGCRQVPTFYLSARVQGITCAAHAARCALDIVDPLGVLREMVHIDAYGIEGDTRTVPRIDMALDTYSLHPQETHTH